MIHSPTTDSSRRITSVVRRGTVRSQGSSFWFRSSATFRSTDTVPASVSARPYPSPLMVNGMCSASWERVSRSYTAYRYCGSGTSGHRLDEELPGADGNVGGGARGDPPL